MDAIITKEECSKIAEYFLGERAATDPKDYAFFLDLYQDLVLPPRVAGTVIQVEEPVFQSHEHIRQLSTKLRSSPSYSRNQFVKDCFKRSDLSDEAFNAISTIVQLNFMVSCDTRERYAKVQNVQSYSGGWSADESFHSFMSRAIPKQEEFICSSEDKNVLTAWKLTKRCGLDVLGTDNLAEHLLVEPKTRTLKVFRHSSWLYAQLERANGSSHREILSQQLLLETLHSLYRILFPLAIDWKGKSRKALNKLIREADFDANAMDQKYLDWLPEEGIYYYWGPRMNELIRYAKNPAPSSAWNSWMERHTSERNILWIAIVGLFLSACFGASQVVVSILAWRYPVSNG